MNVSRLSKTAALSIFLTFASFSMSAPAADSPNDRGGAPATEATPFDMSEFEPVHFSGGDTMAFFDGSEDGVSNTRADERRAVAAASQHGVGEARE